MPTIRPYFSRENAYTGGLQVRASPAAFGAGTAQAVEGLGGAIGQIGAVYQQKQDELTGEARRQRAQQQREGDRAQAEQRQQQADLRRNQAEAEVAWQERNQDVIANGVATYDPSLSIFKAREGSTDPMQTARDTPSFIQADIDAHIAGNPYLANNPRAAAEVRRKLYARIPNAMNEQANWAKETLIADSKRLSNESIAAIQNRVLSNPGGYDTAVTDSDVAIDRQDLSRPDREAMKVASRQDLAALRFKALTVDADTPEALDALEKEANSDLWGVRLHPKDKELALANIQGARKSMLAEFKAEATAAHNDLVQRNTAGAILPDDEIKSAAQLAVRAHDANLVKSVGDIQMQNDERKRSRTISAPDLRSLDYEKTPHASAGATGYLLPLLTKGHTEESITGLRAPFADKLTRLIQSAPPEVQASIGILSGYRTREHQQELWQSALERYGSPGVARKWVAPPGSSQHETGMAADLSWKGDYFSKAPREVQNWVHANARAFGLNFRLDNEPWHIEDGDALKRGYTPSDSSFVALSGAVQRVENRQYDPNAVSPKGAIGLMQVIPTTGREIAIELGDSSFPFNGTEADVKAYLSKPEVSIRYGEHYLQKQLNNYGGDVEAALIAYNAGPSTANTFLKEGRDYSKLPQETQDYIQKVQSELSNAGVSQTDFLRSEAREQVAKQQESALAAGNGMEYFREAFSLPDPDLNSSQGWRELNQQALQGAEFFQKPIEEFTPLNAQQTVQIAKVIKDDQTGQSTMALMAEMQSMSPEVAKAAAKQVGVNDPSFEYLSRLYATGRSGRDIADAAMAGRKRLEMSKGTTLISGGNDRSTDQSQALEQQFVSEMGKSLDFRTDRNTIRDEAFNLFVDRIFSRGNATTDGKQVWDDKAKAAYKQALQDVLGGQGGTPRWDTVNGEKTIMPDGVTGQMFDTMLNDLTPIDYMLASTDSSTPRDADGMIVPSEEIANTGKFKFTGTDPDGGNLYQVQMGDGNWLLAETGKPYKLQFEKLRDKADKVKAWLEVPGYENNPDKSIAETLNPPMDTSSSPVVVLPVAAPEPLNPVDKSIADTIRGITGEGGKLDKLLRGQ